MKWNIGKKLSICVAIVVTISSVGIILFSMHSVKKLFDRKIVESLETEAKLVKGLLVSLDESMIGTVDRAHALLTREFSRKYPAPRLDGSGSASGLASGRLRVNGDFGLVDEIAALSHSAYTVFVRDGNDFRRISTSLKKEDGSRAYNTLLGPNHPARNLLLAGQEYSGQATLFNREYYTKYTPIKDGAAVIGVLFTGVDFTSQLVKMKEELKNIKIGDTGYAYVLNRDGRLVVHPMLEGKTIIDTKDVNGRPFIKEILEKKSGWIRYPWKNEGAGETVARDKIVGIATFDKWGWTVGVGSYFDEFNGEMVEVKTVSLVVAAGFTVLAIMVIVLMARRFVSAPIGSLQSGIIKMADGDLRTPFVCSSRDEIGEISVEMENMRRSLNTIVSETIDISSTIASASNELHATAKQIATGSEEVSAQISTVATASEEMSATSTAIARSCLMAADASQHTATSANNGAAVVTETIDGMSAIANQVRQTSTTVAQLGTRSEQIGAIVGTIEDIADQTNLLALNAAIEAARAGEQGRGFAVVADEVRALAERTTRATREIGDMIKAIQSETRAAVRAMEVGVVEVEKGAISSQKSGQALEEILGRINEVTMQINQIATAAEEQTATTNEVTNNIQQVTDIVQQSARGAGETAIAASQLSDQAQKLKSLVSRFQVC